MATSPRFTKTIQAVPIVTLTDTTLTTVLATSATDRRITQITATSDDTSAQTLTLYISDGITDMLMGAVSIPAASGQAIATPAIDVMTALTSVFKEFDPTGLPIANIAAGVTIKAKMVAITGGKKVYIRVKAELYD